DQHARWLAVGGEAARCLDAVEARHADVHENERGEQAPSLVDRLAAIRGLAHDLDVRRGLEELAETGADERLVVGDQDARAHARGMRARISKPPRSRGPVSSSPPYRPTRSRIPIRPWPAPSPLRCAEPRPSSRAPMS